MAVDPVVLELLLPVAEKAADGAAKLTAYLGTDAGAAAAKDMLQAVGLITVAPDGTTAAATSSAAVAGSGDRSTEPLQNMDFKVLGSLTSALAKAAEKAAADAASACYSRSNTLSSSPPPSTRLLGLSRARGMRGGARVMVRFRSSRMIGVGVGGGGLTYVLIPPERLFCRINGAERRASVCPE